MQLAAPVESTAVERLVRQADSAAGVDRATLTGRRGGGAGGKCRGGDDESKESEATADHSNLADRVMWCHKRPGKVCWRVLA